MSSNNASIARFVGRRIGTGLVHRLAASGSNTASAQDLYLVLFIFIFAEDERLLIFFFKTSL